MKKILIFLIKIYKKTISPFLGNLGIHCKYYPSCSEYMMQAIKKYGCIKGVYLGIKRLIKCNPLTKKEYKYLVWKDIKEINKNLSQFKRIKELILTKEELEKTTTQKIKRFKEIEKILKK